MVPPPPPPQKKKKKLGRVTLRPIDLEHSLSQSPNFGTNHLTTYAHLSPFKHKLKTYLFKNYYFSHEADLLHFTCVLFKFKFILINIYFKF